MSNGRSDNWPLWVFLASAIALLIGMGINGSRTDVASQHVSTQKIKHSWTRTDSLAFSYDQLQAWTNKQFACLQNLWGKESGWDPKALDTVTSQGLKAGGIPQLLGLSPLTPPTEQILRGLNYISYRYITPCRAWEHWQRWSWY